MNLNSNKNSWYHSTISVPRTLHTTAPPGKETEKKTKPHTQVRNIRSAAHAILKTPSILERLPCPHRDVQTASQSANPSRFLNAKIFLPNPKTKKDMKMKKSKKK